MYGQYKMFHREIKAASKKTDRQIAFGNFINLHENFVDKKAFGRNNRYMTLLRLWWETSNWVQLIGPHEIFALNFPEKWTNEHTDRMLRNKWFNAEGDKMFKVATVDKGRLVTHGGLTHGLWVELGKPSDVCETAELLNDRFKNLLFFGDSFHVSGKPMFDADPVFAHPIYETYPSWLTTREPMPFHQVHAGDGLNTISGREALSNFHSPIRFVKKMSKLMYGSKMFLDNGASFLNINPMVPQDELVNFLPTGGRLYVEMNEL